MAKSDPKEARLKAVPLFAKADTKALHHLASAADEVSVSAGHVLIEQGRHHHEFYVIESGTAVVEIEGNEIAEIPAGEFVGELGFFVQGAASATVKAKTDVEPYGDPLQPVRPDPRRQPRPLVRAIATELAIRLHDTDARLHS